MSGGHFDYTHYHIDNIAEEIDKVIQKNKVNKCKDDLCSWDYDENGNVLEDCKYYYNYNDKTIEKFKEAVKILKTAAIYAQRIDWLLSGDDGEEEFNNRTEEELNKLNENNAVLEGKIFEGEICKKYSTN